MADVEPEDGEDEDGKGDVQGEEEEVGVLSKFGEAGCTEQDEDTDGGEAEDDGLGAEAVEQVGLDVEICVERGVGGKESDDDAAEEAMVWV